MLMSATSLSQGRRPPRVLVLVAGVCAVLALIPIGYLVLRTLQAGPEQILATVLRPRTLLTVGTSVGLVAVVVSACLVIGMPIAWYLARTTMPLRSMWLVLAALPLAVPSYVAAYAWLALLPGLQGFWAAALILTLVSLPYVVIPTTVALHRVDPTGEEVARSLGRRPLRAFAATTLPQVWPASAAGALLVALYVLSDFGAVALFRVDAFTRVIYATYRASFDRTSAAVLACLLVLLAIALVAAEQGVRGRRRYTRTSSGVARRAMPMQLRGPGLLAGVALLGAVTVLAVVVPAVSLTLLTLGLTDGGGRSLNWAELGSATAATIWVSSIGALIALLLALPVAALAGRYRTRSTRLIEGAAFAGHALPGVVVALALVFLTVNLTPALYQTAFTLGFAYAVLFLPKVIGSSRTAIAAVPDALDDVARSLGRSAFASWVAVTGRLSWPGAAAGALLVLLTAMKELPATLMLRPTGLDTLATELWSRTEVAAYGAAAPYALALVLLAAVPAWLLARAMRTPEAVAL